MVQEYTKMFEACDEPITWCGESSRCGAQHSSNCCRRRTLAAECCPQGCWRWLHRLRGAPICLPLHAAHAVNVGAEVDGLEHLCSAFLGTLLQCRRRSRATTHRLRSRLEATRAAAVACVTDTVPVPHKHGEAATTMIAMILAKRTLSTTMVIATGGPNASADSPCDEDALR